LVAADCRLTFIDGTGGILARKDRGLKVYPLERHTAIAFAGECDIAGVLLRDVAHALEMGALGPRPDPITLSRWLPRFLVWRYRKRRYGELLPGIVEPRTVFLVGSWLVGAVDDHDVRLTGVFADEENPSLPAAPPRQGLPWGARDCREWTDCMGARSILYTMASPTFEPWVYRPLQFVAIGSGHEVRRVLHEVPLALAYQFADHTMFERMRRFAREAAVSDSGGLHPTLSVTRRGISPVTWRRNLGTTDGRRVEIALTFDGQRWAQRNITTGKVLELVPPWTLKYNSGDELFNDLDELMGRYESP
jgi:hypothetical protein